MGKSPNQRVGSFFWFRVYKVPKGKVETDSSLTEVVSLSQCYHPYSNSITHQSTIGRTKNQFFWGPCQEVGTSAGQSPDSIKLPITTVKRQFVLQTQGTKLTFLSTTKEIIDQLPQPKEPLLSLGLDTTQVELHACSW